MPMPESSFTKKGASSASEPKTRGANRSTKVAGKLKVLPEQPENLPGLDSKAKSQTADKVHAESTGTTGESDEGDADTNEESQEEEVEVRLIDSRSLAQEDSTHHAVLLDI